MSASGFLPSITPKFISRDCTFINQNSTTWFVVHFTGGTPNLQSLYNYWLSQCGVGSNSHYGIERYDNANARAGDIWQFVQHYDGACANCCLESGHAPFLPNANLNVHTISVECINPDTGNNGEMPQAQFDALVYLIKTVCQQEGIPTDKYYEWWNDYETSHDWADGNGGVIKHRCIAPHNRRMCPGTPYYSNSSTSMQAVMDAVNGSGGTSKGNYMDWGSHTNEMVIRMWEAFYVRMNQGRPADQQVPTPRRDTGIFNKWRELLLNQNKYLGAVTSEEYPFD